MIDVFDILFFINNISRMELQQIACKSEDILYKEIAYYDT
tara:strand:- start:199 stop:318 length:120 start_codon:yes stop_codon:yes gene_type:complete